MGCTVVGLWRSRRARFRVQKDGKVSPSVLQDPVFHLQRALSYRACAHQPPALLPPPPGIPPGPPCMSNLLKSRDASLTNPSDYTTIGLHRDDLSILSGQRCLPPSTLPPSIL